MPFIEDPPPSKEEIKFVSKLFEVLQKHVEENSKNPDTEIKDFFKKLHGDINRSLEEILKAKRVSTFFTGIAEELIEIYYDLNRLIDKKPGWAPKILHRDFFEDFIESEDQMKAFGLLHCLNLCAEKVHRKVDIYAEKFEQALEEIKEENDWISNAYDDLRSVMGWYG